MKKLTILIILLMGIKGFSQHPELLDKEWFLHHGILDGETFTPPFLPIGYFKAQINFQLVEFYVYHNQCEEGFSSYVEYLGNENFEMLEGIAYTVGLCSNEELHDFMAKHYAIYIVDDLPKNPFSYSIESDGDNYMLTIENGNGDIAVYGNVPLSTEDFNALTVSIYPNPVKEVLFIKSKENISSIAVFDIYGKAVRSVAGLSSNQTEINLSGLQSGVYFVSITSENGGVLTQKIVKQ